MSIITILIAGIMSVTGIWSRPDRHDRNWDELAPLLAAGGYDAVFYMASIDPYIGDEGLMECLDACLPLGIDVHAWVPMWRIDCMPEVHQRRILDEGRINIELIARTCLRIAAEYPVTGILLDYSGYGDYSDDCVPGGQYYEMFMEWRAGRISDAVRAVRDSLNRINRVVLLSVSVMPHERETLPLDRIWVRWLETGLIDLVIAMNFTESDSQFTAWGEEQIELAGDCTILCGVGAQSSFSELTEGETLHQIALAEDMGFDGWVIYRLCDEVIQMLQWSIDDDHVD